MVLSHALVSLTREIEAFFETGGSFQNCFVKAEGWEGPVVCNLNCNLFLLGQ